jgi:hypothetical protein
MFNGSMVYETPIAQADVGEIGRCMAGHPGENEAVTEAA